MNPRFSSRTPRSSIYLILPAWYQVDENGLVTGAPEPAVLAEVQSEKLP